MTTRSTRRVTAHIKGISGVIAVLITIAMPAIYWSVAYKTQRVEIRTEAAVNADKFADFIKEEPQTWRQERDRLQHLINDDRTESEYPESRALYDERGALVAEAGDKPGRWRISQRAEFYEDGRLAGSVEIARDLSPLLIETGFVGLVGLLLGVGVFAVVGVAPLRELDLAIKILESEKEKAEVTLSSIGDAVITTDAQGSIAYLNNAAAALVGGAVAQAHGKRLDMAVSLAEADGVSPIAGLEAAVTGEQSIHGNGVLVSDDGERRSVDYSFSTIHDANGRASGSVAVLRDITERKRAEERMRYLAHYDSLTGLPNRNLFHDRIVGALLRSARSGQPTALCHLDLDRFKHVNESLGLVAGDQILKLVAERLKITLRDADSLVLLDATGDEEQLNLSRLGGDEFGIVAEALRHAEDARIVATRLLEAFIKPFEVEGQEIFVTPSIGIAIYPDDASDSASLIKRADSAKSRSKKLGGNNFQFYTQDLNDRASDRVKFESSLRHALEEQQWELFYQPKLEFPACVPIGAEALLRWRHPERGLVSPAEFIPILEETGLIVPVGEWVLRTACRQMVAWQRQGLPLRNIAVNLSARQFNQKDLRQVVADALSESGLAAEHLELELTESMLVNDVEASIVTMASLKAMNVLLSIDDFGTGYSSLAYLKRFDIDTLKIDQSFVRDIAKSSDDAAIAKAVVAIARSLRLNTVAEGVETEAQLSFLREEGCAEVQGFLFSRPLPAPAFESWLNAFQVPAAEAMI